jgi:trk system potassium uptake protein TrkH
MEASIHSMNYKMIINLMGRILCALSVFLLPPAGVSACYGEPGALRAILITAALSAGSGLLMLLPKPAEKVYYAREGFIVVAVAWIVISLYGALPFYISGEIPNFVDCLFETISGFTTTGASILPKVEVLSHGLLYWRSFTHWLGGMGVLVFILAIDPMSRGSGQGLYLLRAESPGPDVVKLVPRTHQSAKILYAIYIGLTLLEIALLLLGGMPLFDTVTISFGTAGTGGFAIRSDSLASYSHYIQTVVTIFMMLFGVNFSVYFLLLGRRFHQALRSEELRLYLGIMSAAVVLITWNTLPLFQNIWEALHHSAFQVSSIMTTTGYSTVDFDRWPEFSKTILLILMIIGASAGSTGGGIKVSRLLLLFKSIWYRLRRMLSPHSVSVMRMDGKPVEKDTIAGIHLYLSTYFVVTALSILFVSLCDYGIETTLSAVLACLNNIGPGFGLVGPMSSYASFNDLTKLILSFDMLAGRLEILPILMLLIPSVWKKAQ